MKNFSLIGVLIGMMASIAHGDPSQIVMMSGKSITPSVPSVTFTIKNPGHDIAKTRVFAMTGEEVAELSAKSVSRFFWDGKDVDQQDVPAGLYVVQIRHGGKVWHGPIVVQH